MLENYLDRKSLKQEATRDGFGRGLVTAGEDEKIVVLCGDLTESTRVNLFKEKYPERFIECGVAEQNMMGIAAGLALSGRTAFVASYAVFNPGRNWEQLRLSVCYSEANVKIVGAHAGLSVGPDGATHQAMEDIAITRVLPNMTVVCPCDSLEAEKATIAIASHHGPTYLRLSRAPSPIFTTAKDEFVIGKAQVLAEGKDLTVVACGPLTYEVLVAADKIKDKLSVEVINCPTIKPMDKHTIVTSARKTGQVITVEEHQITGGLGGAVCELLSEHHPTPVKRIGVNDRFGDTGEPMELWEAFGLSAEKLAGRFLEFVS